MQHVNHAARRRVRATSTFFDDHLTRRRALKEREIRSEEEEEKESRSLHRCLLASEKNREDMRAEGSFLRLACRAFLSLPLSLSRFFSTRKRMKRSQRRYACALSLSARSAISSAMQADSFLTRRIDRHLHAATDKNTRALNASQLAKNTSVI